MAPGAYVAALFDNVCPHAGHLTEFVRHAVGGTESQAIARLNVPLTVSVVSHVGDKDVLWQAQCLS
jgi:hypothetical protein